MVRRSLGDGGEGAHLELDDLVHGVDFALRGRTSAHMAAVRLPSSVGVRTLPGSLTRERAKFCDVGDDEAFVEAVLHFGLRFLSSSLREDGDGVDAEVLAVAAVDVDVEVGERWRLRRWRGR